MNNGQPQNYIVQAVPQFPQVNNLPPNEILRLQPIEPIRQDEVIRHVEPEMPNAVRAFRISLFVRINNERNI